jgi:hypothetical protein
MVKKETRMTSDKHEKTAAAAVEKAQAVEAKLREKRRIAQEGLIELDERLDSLAFDAHTGDSKAAGALKELRHNRAALVLDIESIESALTTAGRKVAAAQAAAAREDESRRAELARPIAERLAMRAAAIDEGLAAARNNLAGFYADMNELARLGAPTPSGALVQAVVTRSTEAALVGIYEKVRPVPPWQRHSFSDLFDGWRRPALNWSARVLGDELAAPTPATIEEAA